MTDLFQSARFKLTLWYLAIIMLISIVFSLFIYTLINQEYTSFERLQAIRQERQRVFLPQEEMQLENEQNLLIPEARKRLRAILVLINLGIMGVSGLAGYFLAGRTLEPIKKMLYEQDRFITDSSHELRTPLTSLKSEIEVGLRDKNLNLSESKKLLESNLEEVTKLQYLSDNLIKLTQYRQTDNFGFEEVSLSEVVEEAVKKVSTQAKQKNITLDNKTTNIKFEADKQNLLELLVILLDNAIKYSSKNTKVTLTATKNDHRVEIKVKDEGVGIATEDLPHLFDRFYRSDKSRTKTTTPGYGLGLSIAKQIVEKHQGSIDVESKLDKGSVFIVNLPLKH